MDSIDKLVTRIEMLECIAVLEADVKAVERSAKECPDCGAYYPHHQHDCDLWVEAKEITKLRAVVDVARKILGNGAEPFELRSAVANLDRTAAARADKVCPACKGSRYADYAAVPCEQCGGTG